MIDLACPHCGANHQLGPESAGQRVTCHACGKKFKVPGVSVKRTGSAPSTSVPTQKNEPVSKAPESTERPGAPSHQPSSRDQSQPKRTPAKSDPLFSGPSSESTPAGDMGPGDSHADVLASLDDDFEAPAGFGSPNEGRQVADELGNDDWEQASLEATDTPESTLASPPLDIDDRELPGDDLEPDDMELPSLPLPTDDSSTDDDKAGLGHPAWAGQTLNIDVDDEQPASKAQRDEIRVKCHVCDSVTWVKASKAGKQIVCQDCGTEVTVPDLPTPVEPDLDRPKAIKPKKTAGWQLSQPVDRPRRDLPPELQLDNKTTSPDLHVSKIQRWGDPDPAEQRKKNAGEFSEADHTDAKGKSEQTISEDPVGGYEREEWTEPKKFGLSDWLRDTFVVLRYPSMYGAAVAVAFVCGAFGTVVKVALFYSSEDNAAVMRLLGMCSMLFSLPTLVLAATVVGAVLMTMIQDASTNAKELGSWPEINPSELFPHCAPVYVAGFVAATPGMILAQFVQFVGLGAWGFLVFPLISGFLLLPLLIISAFREQSMFSLYSRPVYDTIGKYTGEWANFAILSFGMFFVALICLLAIGFIGFCIDIPFWLVIGMLWVFYGRWIGILSRRLAWLIQDEKVAVAK